MADLGCGPGHVTRWLAEHGAAAVGVDLSPSMIAVARADNPGCEFRVGDLTDLPARSGEFDAAIAFYSLIHLEQDEMLAALREIHRVLVAGGRLLVSFHVGDGCRHLDEWLGATVDLEFVFLPVSRVCSDLEAAGFVIEAVTERQSYPDEVATLRAYVLARAAGEGQARD